jgi:hypothetical protein
MFFPVKFSSTKTTWSCLLIIGFLATISLAEDRYPDLASAESPGYAYVQSAGGRSAVGTEKKTTNPKVPAVTTPGRGGPTAGGILPLSPQAPAGGASAASSGVTPSAYGALAALFGEPASRFHSTNLYRAPAFLGDFYNSPGIIFAYDRMQVGAYSDIPVAGGAGRLNIADNNKALTEDRLFFNYNHYQNALYADASNFIVGPASRDFSVDRYTLGMEKAFFDAQWSVELRLPLTGRMDFFTPNFSVAGEQLGNLQILLKRMVYETENASAVVGLGVDIPTGGDAEGHVNLTAYQVHNHTVHLDPYAGVLWAPDTRTFCQGFVHVDVPANGDPIDYVDPVFGVGSFGILTEQTLLHVDFAGGYWLYLNRNAPYFTGLASVVELHYTSTLNDADGVSGMGLGTIFVFTERSNRSDILDLTVGLHADLANRTTCRVGAVFPLRTDTDRSFDSEVQVQIERRF